MKTKNKVLALLEIAIVLCSLFLVALPTIAAQEQNQTMQKVSTSEVTTASEDDYVLGVYGNANEDDTIDMRDLTYVKLIFFGKKPETELADAKYDGKLNPLDFIQIKLIIVGKEKELTIVDGNGETVIIRKPVERLIVMYSDSAAVLRALDAKDKIVGIGKSIQDEGVYFPELSKLPSVGSSWNIDYEAILTLNPDVLLTFIDWDNEKKEKLPGVTVIYLSIMFPENLIDGERKLGYVLDKEDEAEEFINWCNGHMDNIKARTKELSDDEKPRVFIGSWSYGISVGKYLTVGKGNRLHQMCVIAGGKNIAEDISFTGWGPIVDPEWVIERNPDIILVETWNAYYPCSCGYGEDDPSEMAAGREKVLNRPELANVAAVKNRRVYMMDINALMTGPNHLMGTAYLVKWFHPELFKDLDPKAIHQEYIDRFCTGLDYDLDEHGVFVYPPLES